MKLNEINAPVSSITGVGPKITTLLAKLNIFTIGELLAYYPRDYEDRTQKHFLKDYNTCHKIHTVAKVLSHEWFGYGTMKTLKIIVSDGTASASLICFNRAFLEKILLPGTIISLTGEFFVKYNSLQSTSFEANVMNLPESSTKDIINLMPLNSKVIPVYPLTEGLTQKNISKAIETALSQYAHGIEDEIPEHLIKKHGLLCKQDAIVNIHKPENLEKALLARKTLAYEELYHFMYVISQRSYKRRGSIQSVEAVEKTFTDEEFISSLSPMQKRLLDSLPYELTPDQKKVICLMNSEIDKGYSERNRILVQYERGIPLPSKLPFTMARLLQGDVGSGKTLCALFMCLRIISWKGQCAFMAPTEILARQHAETTDRLLAPLGIKTAFLTGNVKSSGRTQLLKALKAGNIDIVIGTHALFSSQVQYNDLELVVIDEQHRFGVLQRQAIVAKGRTEEKCGITFEPHLLMMSATPIPQSLALTLYGDLDVCSIKTMPQGRKAITTYLVKEGNEANAYEAVRKELEKGHQAYFVYPAIDSEFTMEEGSSPLKSAEKSFELLSKRVYPGFECALLHSKVDEDEQVRILHEFKEGKIKVLAATTVIEVGVDVPNATCMVIEMADRFGMAQLHQLRGRVGRGSEQSYCFLIYSKNITQTGIERMKALRESTDGFYISEQDLKTRGPGELTGTAQSGAIEFQIADLSKDMPLLSQAKIDAVAELTKA